MGRGGDGRRGEERRERSWRKKIGDKALQSDISKLVEEVRQESVNERPMGHEGRRREERTWAVSPGASSVA